MSNRTKKEPEPKAECEEQAEDYAPLSGDQERAAAYLARVGYVRGSNRRSGAIRQCGAYIGVHENTIITWCKLPAFQAQLEGYSDRLTDKAFRGLEILLEGCGDIPPNVTSIIWWLKTQKPELFDDQFRREEAKRKHELALAEKANGGGGEERPDPDYSFRETAPGERLVEDDEPDEDE